MLCAWSTGVVSDNPEKSKKASLCKSIKEAKRQHRLKMEAYYTTADSWHMCQGLQHHRQKGATRKIHIYSGTAHQNWLMCLQASITCLCLSFVPTSFKSTTIVLLPKNCTLICLNNVNHIAFTPILTKCFERIVMIHIKRSIPATLDSLQLVYR